MSKPLTNYYDILNILTLRVDDFGPGKKLGSFLYPYRIVEPRGESVELILCRQKEQIPKHLDELRSAKYKGIPWIMAIDCCNKNQIKRVYFYAAYFFTFLVLRIVLVPLLNYFLIKKGGFNILGSAFRYQDRTVFIFGRPGSGKTHLTLQALDKGAIFIADNELLFFENGEIHGLTNEFELRWNTAKDTLFWHQLTPQNKFCLLFYEMISVLSFRTISFNLSFDATDLGIMHTEKERSQNLLVIHLTDEHGEKRSTLESFINAVMNYEKWYQSVFGGLITKYIEDNRSQLKRNMTSFFSDSSIWQMPIHADIEKILITV